MCGSKWIATIAKIGVALGVVAGVGACSSYDYLQNTDKVSLGAGDAVKANIEIQTVNPSADHQYDVSHLGEGGQVVGPGVDTATTP